MNKNILKLEGRSGCQLEFVKNDSGLIIRKYSSNDDYNKRLEKQWNKQEAFTTLSNFFAPKVLNKNNQGVRYWFDMEYVSGDKYSGYFTQISKNRIDEIIANFRHYFKTNIHHAQLISAPIELFQEKTESLMHTIEHKVSMNAHVKINLKNYLQQIPTAPFYIGKCHGDFTLSNMLFLKDHRICVFDLLDSFVESPLIDWVKLKQDTCFHWSMHIENETLAHNTKLVQVLSYINNQLNSYFKDDVIITAWEPYLTVLNLARILPYAKDERDLTYLTKHLTKLI